MTIDRKYKIDIYCKVLIEKRKVSALSSGKIDQCEYLASEAILPSNQSKMMQ